jgi:hypothetical protein
MHYLDRFMFLFADLLFGLIVSLYCVVSPTFAPLVAEWILPRLLCGKNTILVQRILQQAAAKQKEVATLSVSCDLLAKPLQGQRFFKAALCMLVEASCYWGRYLLIIQRFWLNWEVFRSAAS